MFEHLLTRRLLEVTVLRLVFRQSLAHAVLCGWILQNDRS